jgi:hypothetical protein
VRHVLHLPREGLELDMALAGLIARPDECEAAEARVIYSNSWRVSIIKLGTNLPFKGGEVLSLHLIQLIGIAHEQPDSHIRRVLLETLWIEGSSHCATYSSPPKKIETLILTRFLRQLFPSRSPHASGLPR